MSDLRDSGNPPVTEHGGEGDLVHRRCGLCKREGAVGYHPKPHHGDSYLCVSRRACLSRWRRNLMRRAAA